MIKLIKLEYKKNKISRYVRKAFIMTLCLVMFIFAMNYFGIANDPDTGLPDADNGDIAIVVDVLTTISFFIFAAAMQASFIMKAYKNKTMNLMFLYPIKRRKIVIAQMVAVLLFNFVALILAQAAIFSSLYIGSFYFTPAFQMDTRWTDTAFVMKTLLKDAMSISISLIALFIGIILKSSKSVILSCFLLVTLLQGTIGDISFVNNVAIPIILTCISAFFAGLSIYRVNKKDMM